MTTEFEACIYKTTTLDKRHNKQSRSSQINFAQQVQGMVEVNEEMGNLFMEEPKDLLRLDTRDIVDPTVSSICCAEEKGIEQEDCG